MHGREERADDTNVGIDFTHVRQFCENDAAPCDIDISPLAFAKHRGTHWPHSQFGSLYTQYDKIYEAVRESGVPNAIGVRAELPTKLNLEAWDRYLKGYDDTLLDYLRYGFPLGYLGPKSDTSAVSNHPSALQYAEQVDAFIQKEGELGGLIGPFDKKPFDTWCHISPLMTRPKADPAKRRVITDLTFPRASSVNAYIRKNTVMGLSNTHTLPSVDAVVQRVIEIGPGAPMFTIDVSRAYKNFKSCPLDWPLLAVKWREAHYLDITMPFGARASSGHMQRVADAIVAILAKHGITAYMYLDDLVVVATDMASATAQYTIARDLLAELGLPEAFDKSQPPSTRITWLGIEVDSIKGTLTIPAEKLKAAISLAATAIQRRSVTRKQLQSIIGKLLHVAKCIKPARLFIARLLDQLRGTKRPYININSSMRADLQWFLDFADQWNGVAIFPKPAPEREIVVDACMNGIGGATHRSAYAYRIPENTGELANISEIEAINIAVALQTFVGESNRGKCVKVLCDNMATVHVLQSGKGKNLAILEAARAAWMVQAIYQVTIYYEHISGRLNVLADALSRAHISEQSARLADDLVHSLYLNWINPCLHAPNLVNGVLSRRTLKHSGDISSPPTGQSEGRGDKPEQAFCHLRLPKVLPSSQVAPTAPHIPAGVYIHRAPESDELGTADDPEPRRAYTRVSTVGGCPAHRQPLQGEEGGRGDTQEKRLCEGGQAPARSKGDSRSNTSPPCDKAPAIGPRCSVNDLLRRIPPSRGDPTVSKTVRPPKAPDQGGCQAVRRQAGDKHQGREESTKIRSKAPYYCFQSTRPGSMPHRGCESSPETVSNHPHNPTHVCVQGHSSAHHRIICQDTVGDCPKNHWGATTALYPAYP